jgi:hypothetical protein
MILSSVQFFGTFFILLAIGLQPVSASNFFKDTMNLQSDEYVDCRFVEDMGSEVSELEFFYSKKKEKLSYFMTRSSDDLYFLPEDEDKSTFKGLKTETRIMANSKTKLELILRSKKNDKVYLNISLESCKKQKEKCEFVKESFNKLLESSTFHQMAVGRITIFPPLIKGRTTSLTGTLSCKSED